MNFVKLLGYGLLLVCLLVMIVMMNGEGETAVSAESSQNEGGVPEVTTALVASGFQRPVDIAHAGDERLFIVEEPGVIRIIDTDGNVLPTPFLDISENVADSGNLGMLGLAFDPYYEETGYFYVSYTHCAVPNTCPYSSAPTPNLSTRISRFEVSSDPYIANANSELIVMEVARQYPHHNGGDLNFGLDGYLYIGLGDGRDPDDRDNNAQNMALLLGKILRIDVQNSSGLAPDCDPDGVYKIPNASGHFGNPFVDGAGGSCDEIWSLGLRNPWRFSFDRATGSMFIGDVGQRHWEEVDFQPGNGGGENWGWRCYEGSHEHLAADCDDIGSYEFPIVEYAHSEGNETIGCAVTGGYIYRGQDYPTLNGYYIYADYCEPRVWITRADVQGVWDVHYMGALPGLNNASTFGENCRGELFVADHLDGEIYQIQVTESSQLFGGDSHNFLPIVVKPLVTPSVTPGNQPLPTPTFTPSPTTISPDQCLN